MRGQMKSLRRSLQHHQATNQPRNPLVGYCPGTRRATKLRLRIKLSVGKRLEQASGRVFDEIQDALETRRATIIRIGYFVFILG